MSDVTVVSTVEPDPVSDEHVEANAEATEAVVEAAETVAESATDVAQIEADAQVAIAQIHADVEHDRIGAALEATDHSKELEACQIQIVALTSDLQSMRDLLSSTLERLERLENPPQSLSEAADGVVMPASQEAPEEPAQAAARPHHRWI